MTLSLSVADDRLGAYYRKTMAIADRLDKSLDFDKVMGALQRIHDGHLDPVVLRTGEFSVYLEIETGGKSKNDLLAEMKAGGHSVSDWAKDIMSKDDWKPGEKQTVKFARAKISELGFTKNPTTAQIWARIEELGHSLCEPQDGPAIRRDLKDQPRGDAFWVAMKRIADSGGGPSVFYVERRDDGKSWLYAYWVYPDDGWNLVHEVVFRLRK